MQPVAAPQPRQQHLLAEYASAWGVVGGGVGKVTKDATAKVLRDTKVVKIACVQEDMGNLWKCHDSDYCGNLVSSPMELEQNDWKR